MRLKTYVYAPPQDYASHCYIVVIQDVRGQYKSGGEYYPFRDEAADGFDTVEWAAALPGSNGKVGMYGFSFGATQWLAATQRPPHLSAIVPAQTSSDYYDGWSYEGGAFSLAFEESWPLTTIALSATRRLGDQALLDEISSAGASPDVYRHLPLADYLGPSSGQQIAPYSFRLGNPRHLGCLLEAMEHSDRYQQVQVPALNFAG